MRKVAGIPAAFIAPIIVSIGFNFKVVRILIQESTRIRFGHNLKRNATTTKMINLFVKPIMRHAHITFEGNSNEKEGMNDQFIPLPIPAGRTRLDLRCAFMLTSKEGDLSNADAYS